MIRPNEEAGPTTMTAANGITVEEVRTLQEFQALKDSWSSLLLHCSDNNIFLTWEWLFTWWQYYNNGQQLRILIIKERDKLIGIAPLMQTAFGWGPLKVTLLENICGRECDYSGVIIDANRPEVISILAEYIKTIIEQDKLIFRISEIPETSQFLTLFRKQYADISKTCEITDEPIDTCMYITLPTTFSEYFNNLARHARKNLRRRQNALEKDHRTIFENQQGPEAIEKISQTLFDLHQNRWNHTNVTSKYTKESVRNFHYAVSRLFDQQGWLAMSTLSVDDTIVSVRWGFKYNQAFHAMTKAWHLDWANYSVSNLHELKTIESSIQEGLTIYDFLKGDMDYKRQWTSTSRDNYRITICQAGKNGWYQKKLLKLHWRLGYIKNHSLGYIVKFILYSKILKRKTVLFD